MQEIDGASNRGIDDIRELRETSRYQPSRDRFRVFIIDEVHMLTREAFNALLKTLEEPPPHVVFIFATTEYQKVPATIISRCQHFEFRRIERTTLATTLAGVADHEGVKLGERGADLIARNASGSLRDALGYLDQAVAYCGEEITDEGLREILGVAGLESVDAFYAGVAARDAGAIVGLIDRLARGGQDLGHFCKELVERGRELLLLRAAPDAPAVLGFTDAEAKEAKVLAERFSPEDLLRIGASLTELEGRMRFSPHTRFLLEMAAVRMVRAGSVVPLDDLIARVETLASGSSSTGGAAPAGSSSTGRPPGAAPRNPGPGKKATAASGATAAPQETAAPPVIQSARAAMAPAASGAAEEDIRGRITAKRNALGSYLEHACEFRIDGDRLVIKFPARHALFKNGLARADNRQLVAEAAREATGRNLKIDVGIAPEGEAVARPFPEADRKGGSRDALMSEAMQEPIVRSLMDQFGARVVRVEEVKPS